VKKLKFFAQKKSKWIFICYLFLLLILFSGLVTVCYFDIENHIDSPNIIILIILIFILAVPSLFVTSKTLFDLCIGAIFFRKETKLVLSKSMPKLVTVAIVIPTFNDFMEREIKKCFYQEYDKNKYVVKKYILDDSTDEEQIKQIDDFAKFNNVIVLRQTAENKKKYGSSCGLAAAFNYFIEQTKGK
jgi:Flp pilus assembly protein protease CpaA